MLGKGNRRTYWEKACKKEAQLNESNLPSRGYVRPARTIAQMRKIPTTTNRALTIVDGTRNVRELEYRVECDWVKDPSLVIVSYVLD